MGRVADFFREQSITLAQQQRAKMISLDRQVEELDAKVQILETQNLHLQAEVNPLKKTIQRLEQQLKQQGAAVQHKLEPTEIEMMKFIGDQKSVTASGICDGMVLNSVTVEHFLGRLLKANYVVQHKGYGLVPVMYSLDDKGNAYLVENQLVSIRGGPAMEASNPKGHHCDHCGGIRLRRTGSKPDPTFHDVGIKMAMYSCLHCGKESGFTNDES